jgi:hypothetical protein
MQMTVPGGDAAGHGPSRLAERELRSRMTYSRLIGGLFLAGFLFYGVGSALVDSIVGEADFVTTIPDRQNLLIFGAFLMLLNTGVDIGKGVLFFPILENHGKRTALPYLAALIVQVVVMNVGVLFVLMLVPLGQLAVDAGGTTPAWVADLGTLLTESNTTAYNVGQAVLSFGGVFLCWLLLRTALIPRGLAALGLVGYVLHGVGSSAEIFQLEIGSHSLDPRCDLRAGAGLLAHHQGIPARRVRQGLPCEGRCG